MLITKSIDIRFESTDYFSDLKLIFQRAVDRRKSKETQNQSIHLMGTDKLTGNNDKAPSY